MNHLTEDEWNLIREAIEFYESHCREIPGSEDDAKRLRELLEKLNAH